MIEPEPPFIWDNDRKCYRDGTGKDVDMRWIYAARGRLGVVTGDAVKDVSMKLINGEVDLNQWTKIIQEIVEAKHLAHDALLAGGLDTRKPAIERERTREEADKDFNYIRRLAQNIENGRFPAPMTGNSQHRDRFLQKVMDFIGK